MRSTPWLTAAMLTFGCAQGGGRADPAVAAPGEPAADAGLPPADPGGADAGAAAGSSGSDGGGAAAAPPAPLARYCDPALDPAADVTITDTGACPGIMPAAPDCASEIELCSGTSGSLGPSGTFAADAVSDGEGAVAVRCARNDVGPPGTYTLFDASAAGYSGAVPLGAVSWPLESGFVSLTAGYDGTPPADYLFVSHDGARRTSIPQGDSQVYVGPKSIEIVSFPRAAAGWTLSAQKVDAGGAAVGAPQPLAEVAGSGTLILGGGADLDGHTLVVWGVYGQQGVQGRWLAPDGTPETGVFPLSGWGNNIGRASPLPGGGVALGGVNGPSWRAVIAAGSTVEGAVPDWLGSRGGFSLVRGGRAMLFGGEVLLPDGTKCGTLAFAAAGGPYVGADGTVFTDASGTTFRIYPQLLR